MRIIGGLHGSRIFEAPKGKRTHPMSGRARGALFNALGPLDGMTVLDAFAGSGALSFEAISRGASLAVAVDRDAKAAKMLKANVESLNLEDQVQAIQANVSSWSSQNKERQFDLIFCDPPYDNLQLPTVEKLVRHLDFNGLMVVSYPGRESAPTVNGVVVVDRAFYGDAALAYYRIQKTNYQAKN